MYAPHIISIPPPQLINHTIADIQTLLHGDQADTPYYNGASDFRCTEHATGYLEILVERHRAEAGEQLTYEATVVALEATNAFFNEWYRAFPSFDAEITRPVNPSVLLRGDVTRAPPEIF